MKLFLTIITHLLLNANGAIWFDDIHTMINKIISFSGGTITNFPRIENYSINNNYETDGYAPESIYQYDAVVSSEITLGTFFTINYKKCLVNYNHAYLLLSADLSYKNSYYSIKYSSSEKYCDSTIIYGNGTATWKEHYIAPALGITLLSQIGKKTFIENNLSIDKGFLIKSRENIIFNGEISKGINYEESYDRNIRRYYSAKSNPIKPNLLDIFYEIGFGYKVNKNIMILSDITIPIINIQKEEIESIKQLTDIDGVYKNPRFVRKNYNSIFWGFKLNYLLK